MDVKVGQDVFGVFSKGLYVEEVVVMVLCGDGVVFFCYCWIGDEDKVIVKYVQQIEQEVFFGKLLQCIFKRGFVL